MFFLLLLQKLLCTFCLRNCIKWEHIRRVQILFVQVLYWITFCVKVITMTSLPASADICTPLYLFCRWFLDSESSWQQYQNKSYELILTFIRVFLAFISFKILLFCLLCEGEKKGLETVLTLCRVWIFNEWSNTGINIQFWEVLRCFFSRCLLVISLRILNFK